MKKFILTATMIAASLLGHSANADQIISLPKTEVKALNAALNATSSVEYLFKCKEIALELFNAGAKIKSGNHTGSNFGTMYQFDFVKAGQTKTLVVRESYLDNNGQPLNPSVVECRIAAE